MVADVLYPCPCCGYLTFVEPPGSDDICEICFWQDDQVQLRWPLLAGGANKPSLVEAQANVSRIGAVEERLVRYVRQPHDSDRREQGWRPVDLTLDHFEPLAVQDDAWPADTTHLYWWRPTFWRSRGRSTSYGPATALRLIGSDTVHLDTGTRMWVQVTRFAIDATQPDRAILSSLIASPAYAYDYASPFDADAKVTEPAVHGRWWRDRIHVDLFEPWAPADAETLIKTWADHQDWYEPGYRQPHDVHARLNSVYQILRSGHLYKLINPGADDEHDYGYVTGTRGFHEFVAVDRLAHHLQVVVASDD